MAITKMVFVSIPGLCGDPGITFLLASHGQIINW
jgi:hypothetical protein